MKLWKKGYDVDKEIEKFTVGNDYILDKELVYYDCIASISHAKMLKKINVLTETELKKLMTGLDEIIRIDKEKKFKIKPEDEDCHTAIENYLTKKCGEVGKKIHTARSRNDQVLTALRLYEKDKLKEIIGLIGGLIFSINRKVKLCDNVNIPGYTHMQKAMPTTIGMLLSSYTDSLKDDKLIIENTLKIIDKSPLGSAAGFNVPVFDVDKEMTAKLLNFASVQDNPIYCQNSRGKFESLIVANLLQVMMTLNKISTDLILFSMQEFSFFSLPKEFCTGSSIMPQKKNPDVLELLRARYSVILGYDATLKSLCSNLMSGYNRDMQLTKEPVMSSFNLVKDCVKILSLVFEGVVVNKLNCEKALTKELYATKDAYELVKEGMSFRDAYKEVGKKFI